MTGLTRRRFLAVSAAAVACGASARAETVAVWRGVALGARAEIRIAHEDRAAANAILADCRREILRLEALFSLYRADSAIVRLNRDGMLADPDPDFLALLSIAAAVHRQTGGVFDPTVQPLWEAYAHGKAPETAATGLGAVDVGPAAIAFRRPDMALTLNGIAQGFITDRIADLLRARGLRQVLVNIGELRALDGRAWPVRIDAPGAGGKTVRLRDRALATSDTLATTFDTEGRLGHIIDPRNGAAATVRRGATVAARTAAVADALSTAFCLMRDGEIQIVLERFPDAGLVHSA